MENWFVFIGVHGLNGLWAEGHAHSMDGEYQRAIQHKRHLIAIVWGNCSLKSEVFSGRMKILMFYGAK